MTKGFIYGLFNNPPFPVFCIGIATWKYSGKKRLIIDLSSPHGSHILSINNIIPIPDFSTQYATINYTIYFICLAGHGAWLSKADITSTFQVLPVHLDSWPCGFAEKEPIIFLCALTLAAEAVPKSLVVFHKPCAGSWLTTTDSHTYFIF